MDDITRPELPAGGMYTQVYGGQAVLAVHCIHTAVLPGLGLLLLSPPLSNRLLEALSPLPEAPAYRLQLTQPSLAGSRFP